jgi:hypothetical protein
MAYDEWDEGFQDTWDEIPGIPYLESWENDYASDLYERGFTHHAEDPGYDADDVAEAREEFFEFMGLEDEDFPWDDWREAMGYE